MQIFGALCLGSLSRPGRGCCRGDRHVSQEQLNGPGPSDVKSGLLGRRSRAVAARGTFWLLGLVIPAALLAGCGETSITPPNFVSCPPGYESPASERQLIHGKFNQDIEHCRYKCDRFTDCSSFLYSPRKKACFLLHGSASSTGDPYLQLCRKTPQQVPTAQQVLTLGGRVPKSGAPFYPPSEVTKQTGAEIQAGSAIGVYVIGSSSVVWTTWVEELHLALVRLGYTLPLVPAQRTPETYPRRLPTCDDAKYYHQLRTSRFGRIGWSSWDFAMDGWQGCGPDGFRSVLGHRIKCQHGAGCAFSKNAVYVDDLARDASYSNITLLATHFNDIQFSPTQRKCFGGAKMRLDSMMPLTLQGLRSTVRAIHKKSPHTWVVILAKYPETYMHKTVPLITDYNMRVKIAMEQEPKTLFVDYYMPNNYEGKFYQSVPNGGHPNCRGGKIMAHAVLHKLFDAKVIAQSLKQLPATKGNLLKQSCSTLTALSCHSSGFCWLDPEDHKCKTYGIGSWHR